MLKYELETKTGVVFKDIVMVSATPNWGKPLTLLFSAVDILANIRKDCSRENPQVRNMTA